MCNLGILHALVECHSCTRPVISSTGRSELFHDVNFIQMVCRIDWDLQGADALNEVTLYGFKGLLQWRKPFVIYQYNRMHHIENMRSLQDSDNITLLDANLGPSHNLDLSAAAITDVQALDREPERSCPHIDYQDELEQNDVVKTRY